MIEWIKKTRYGKWRFKRFENKIRSKCYLSIRYLPIRNWWALNGGDLESLYKDEFQELGKGHKFILIKIADEIYDQFFKQFGFGEKMSEIIEKEKEITLLYLRKVRDNDDTLLTDIEIAEKELNNMKKELKTEPVNLPEIIASVESLLHVTIDMEKCTTEKFYGYMKLIEKRK